MAALIGRHSTNSRAAIATSAHQRHCQERFPASMCMHVLEFYHRDKRVSGTARQLLETILHRSSIAISEARLKRCRTRDVEGQPAG